MPRLRGWQLVMLTVMTSLASFMEMLDTTITNVSVPTIAGNLGAAVNQGTWVVSSYAVASAIMMPLTGWLARRMGEVHLFFLSMMGFTVISTLCGMAPTFDSLVVARLLQGFVSGPMVALAQTLLLNNYPPEKRGMAMGFWAITVIVAPICGPVLGGWITENWSWPWIFYINIPFGLFAAFAVAWLMRGRESAIQRDPIDYVGLALLVVGVGAFQLMLDNGNEWGWLDSPAVVGLAVVATASLAFFIAWELGEPNPVVDLKLFANRNFSLGVTLTALGYATFFGSVVVYPLWLQIAMGYSPSWAGLAAAPTALLSLFITPVIGKNIHRLNAKYVLFCAFGAFAAVSYWASGYTLAHDYWHVIGPRFAQGLGVGLFFVPAAAIAVSSIRVDQTAAASGIYNFLRTLGGAVGTAVAVTVLEQRGKQHYAQLGEHLQVGKPSFDAFNATLSQVLRPDQTPEALDRMLSQQAMMLAADDFFRASMWVFMALAIVSLFTNPPKGVAIGAGGH